MCLLPSVAAFPHLRFLCRPQDLPIDTDEWSRIFVNQFR